MNMPRERDQADVEGADLSGIAVVQRLNRKLLAVIQSGNAVLYGGAVHRLRAAVFHQDGGDIVASVYLADVADGKSVHEIDFLQVVPAEPTDQLDAGAEQNRVILHALHTAYPLQYQERNCFVHTIRLARTPAGLIVTVWLAGRSEAVAPQDLHRGFRPDPVS